MFVQQRLGMEKPRAIVAPHIRQLFTSIEIWKKVQCELFGRMVDALRIMNSYSKN